MKGERIPTHILAVRMIPHADKGLMEKLGVPKELNSLGLFTTDSDDVSYAALDEATKKASVQVVYAKSMYAGAPHASTRLAGEFIGILAGPDPEDVRSGIEAARRYIDKDAAFYSACDDNSVIYFAQCISRTGFYLSKQAGVEPGCAMAYLIAPPLEATYGLDAALKAAEVEMKVFYGPPTETNFAGGLLVGEQAACKAACEAFADKVCDIAQNPLSY